MCSHVGGYPAIHFENKRRVWDVWARKCICKRAHLILHYFGFPIYILHGKITLPVEGNISVTILYIVYEGIPVTSAVILLFLNLT